MEEQKAPSAPQGRTTLDKRVILMAKSPAHQFGQIIGNLVETVIRPLLEEFCSTTGFYLDYRENDRPARKGKKVAWEDQYGNIHDLDYVIERNGADAVIGSPVAFIEVAWRRYTKHSRNKAQEIQGAILPLAETYKWNNPFLGTVLAGVFTAGSLKQLKSVGFTILYFPYETLVDVFNREGIDIQYDEDTPDEECRQRVDLVRRTDDDSMCRIKNNLLAANKKSVCDFFDALRDRIGRRVERVVILPLYGEEHEFASIHGALLFLAQYNIREAAERFRKYEVLVSFSNGDKVDGVFALKQKAYEFLEFVASQ